MNADIAANGRYVLRQMRLAKQRGAEVAHFPEACLSGYAGVDFHTHDDLDWQLLDRMLRRVLDLAAELRLWVVLGSAHRLTGTHKPHNSLYIIDGDGGLVDRYDKRFCAGNAEETTGDLAHYTPGNHMSVFTIHGVRCGALICYDYRYPELYREYKRQGVQLVFHSYHAANMTAAKRSAIRSAIDEQVLPFNSSDTYPGITMPAMMTAQAAANHVWISCPNSSARESCWGSFFVRADGVTAGRVARNRTGVLISVLDTDADLYDSTAAWRARAMDGVLHSGSLVRDVRSEQRTEL